MRTSSNTSKTNQKTYAGKGAGSFQGGNCAGWCSDTTSHQKGEAPRPKIDQAKIDSFISPSELSKSWAPYGWRGQFVLPPQPHIAINRTHTVIGGGGRPHSFRLEWFSSKTGVGGVGAVSLCAHVLKVSKDEAAWRLAHWLAAGRFAGSCGFWGEVTLQTEQVAA